MTFPEMIVRNKACYLQHAREFKKVFGVELRPYFDFVTGFDIVRFDDEFVKSGDRAMSDVIQERHGSEAVTLIEKLIGLKEEAREKREQMATDTLDAHYDTCEWRKALQALTPGGSEFLTPGACREWAERRWLTQHNLLLQTSIQRNSLRESVGHLLDWATHYRMRGVDALLNDLTGMLNRWDKDKP